MAHSVQDVTVPRGTALAGGTREPPSQSAVAQAVLGSQLRPLATLLTTACITTARRTLQCSWEAVPQVLVH
eukprot:scaffold7390_cov420-Prasinococcus_capsulatus_cf.AAC.6